MLQSYLHVPNDIEYNKYKEYGGRKVNWRMRPFMMSGWLSDEAHCDPVTSLRAKHLDL